MFAGDKSKPAADASYKNLFWENLLADQSFNVGTKIQRNKQIGFIDSLGPFFRVHLDLLVHNLHNFPQSVLAFYTSTTDTFDIYIIDSKFLLFSCFINNRYQSFVWEIEQNRWYNLIIEKKTVNRKVIKSKILSLYIFKSSGKFYCDNRRKNDTFHPTSYSRDLLKGQSVCWKQPPWSSGC